MVVLRSLVVAAAVATAGAASAHVSLSPPSATAGGYQVLRFGLGHGCDGKATTALRIEIPPGVETARPQPKSGWTLSLDRAPDGGTVRAIVWTGELPPDLFDEFLILAKLPTAAGPLAFPATQACGDTVMRWNETAPPGAARPQHPAPTLLLTPAATSPEGGHEHHHH